MRLLLKLAYDTMDGTRPLPWLTPSITRDGDTISWTSSGKTRPVLHITTLSFCPGEVIAGEPHLLVVGTGEITSPLCTSLLLSIANPKKKESNPLQEGV